MKFKALLIALPLTFILGCSEDEKTCDTGYRGDDCEVQIIPSKIRVSSIVVTEFPNLNKGILWDTDSFPDIYPVVSLIGTTVIYNASTVDSNAVSPGRYVFDGPFDLNPLTAYKFTLRDYDPGSTDPIMGTFEAGVYNSSNGFPAVVNLEDNGLKLQLNVSYEF